MKEYPKLFNGDFLTTLQFIVKERKTDVSDWNNLQNRFISGRKVARIPTTATDVLNTDRIGDFNIAYDGADTYLYSLVDVSGTATWARVLMDTGW